MKRIVFAGAAALVAAVVLTSQSVETYYDDVHYSFTYYMARACGYTPLQAHRLASADVSIDYSVATEPIQGQKARDISSVPVLGNSIPLGSRTGPEEARVRFHAMRDDRLPNASPTGADAEIKRQEAQLRQLVRNQHNPGILLHFLQDETSHKGYASAGGHWYSQGLGRTARVTTGQIDIATPGLPYGATTDYLSHDQANALMMTTDTYNALVDFMVEATPYQKLRDCTPDRLLPLLDRLIAVNPVSNLAQQYAKGVSGIVSDSVHLADGAPDVRPANDEVRRALSLEGELKKYENDPIRYEFDLRGNLTKLPAYQLTLYGTLNVRLQGTGAAQAQEVSVWADRTRGTEAPYELACADNSRPGPFDRLPVGDLIVQAVGPSGKITRQSVTLTKLQQEVVVNVPGSREQPSECEQQARQLSRQICAATTGRVDQRLLQSNPVVLLPAQQQLQNDEEQFASQLKNCQAQTQTTKKSESPAAGGGGRTGGGAGKAVAAVAVAGGAGLAGAIALQKYLDTLNTTGPSSSSSSSSSSGSSARCSTRNCIVNVLGSAGSCDCVGSFSTTCPSSNIQTQVGGSCFNNGMYCAENLSCNNNRCERDFASGGRCR